MGITRPGKSDKMSVDTRLLKEVTLTVAAVIVVLTLVLKRRCVSTKKVFTVSVALFAILFILFVVLHPGAVVNPTKKGGRELVIEPEQQRVRTAEEAQGELDKKQESVNTVMADSEFDKDEMRAGMCSIEPSGGKCNDGFQLKDGCCNLEEFDSMTDAIKAELWRSKWDILAQMASEELIEQAVKFAFSKKVRQSWQKSLPRTSKYVTKASMKGVQVAKMSGVVARHGGAWVVDKVAPKGVQKAASKAVAYAAKTAAAKGAAKLAASIAVKMACLSLPAVGWVLLALDVIVETMNAADMSGYNLDVDYYTLKSQRNTFLIQYRQTCLDSGLKPSNYPPMFNIFDDTQYTVRISKDPSVTNANVFGEIMQMYSAATSKEKTAWISSKDAALQDAYVNSIIANPPIGISPSGELVAIPTTPMTPEQEAQYAKYETEWVDSGDPVGRDKYIHEALNAYIAKEHTDLEKTQVEAIQANYTQWPGMSGPLIGRCAVSLSHLGATNFNKGNREKVLKGFNYFNPDQDDKEAASVIVATVSNKAFIPTGKNERTYTGTFDSVLMPGMELRNLAGTGCFGFPLAHLWSYCESKKDGGAPVSGLNIISGRTSLGTLDPLLHGVRFNRNTLLCEYTEDYCDRMGLDFEDTTKSCKVYGGQDFFEMFLPKDLIRGTIRAGKAVVDCGKDPAACLGKYCPQTDDERPITTMECCNLDHNCGTPDRPKKSCHFCKYGHRYSCVGGQDNGADVTQYDGNFCQSSRRCMTKEESEDPNIIPGEELVLAPKCMLDGIVNIHKSIAEGFGNTVLGIHCPLDGKGQVEDPVCCRLDRNCGPKGKPTNSCAFCKYGHTYSCVGNEPEGANVDKHDGKYCGSSRRCRSKDEKDKVIDEMAEFTGCISGGVEAAVTSINDAIFGGSCPTTDQEKPVTGAKCCEFTADCGSKDSPNTNNCHFCKYGHTYSCVGNEGPGADVDSHGGKYCSTSRRCLKKNEKPDQSLAGQIGQCVGEGLVNAAVDLVGVFGGGEDKHQKNLKRGTCCTDLHDRHNKNICHYCKTGADKAEYKYDGWMTSNAGAGGNWIDEDKRGCWTSWACT